MERVIVAGVDRSARSRVAADWAAYEALRRGCSLHVVHVSPLNGLDAAQQGPYRPEIVADQGLDRVMARHPVLRAESVRLTGTASRALHSQSREAEMIVLGLRGDGGHAGLPWDRPLWRSPGPPPARWCWCPAGSPATAR